MTIYCSGIGGIGLSAYAALQNASGHTVLGSDRSDSDLIQDLRSQGIEVSLNQDGAYVPDDLDLFVYSEAIAEDAPERIKAKEYGVRQVSYFGALGELSKDYENVIAVCGTHGKSTTTAMAAKVLMDAELDPTVIVGTKTPDLDGKNWKQGGKKYLLVEACEYRRSFHYLHPTMILMLNVDGDHFDAFYSVEDYQQAFVEFLKLLSEEEKVITHYSTDQECKKVADASGRNILDADLISRLDLNLHVPGKHMQDNALLVLALSAELGIDSEKASNSLRTFKGTWRRMEVKGTNKDGVTVVDDYAHHPLEVEATMAAMHMAYPDRRLVCVFQPHLHSRMRRFYDEFIKRIKGSDVFIVTDIYKARDDVGEEVDVEKFVSDLKVNMNCLYGGSLENTEKLLRDKILQQNDVLLVMGAGDVTNLAAIFVSS